MTSNVHMQNLVTEVTDALVAGENAEMLQKRYEIDSQAAELIELIERINQSMVKVEPSVQFTRRLKADLLEENQYGVVRRFRKLPGRVRAAATAALIWGSILILRRIFFGEPAQQHSPEESSALQEKY